MSVASSNRCVVPNDTKKKNRRCQPKKKGKKGGGGVEGRGARILMNSGNLKKKKKTPDQVYKYPRVSLQPRDEENRPASTARLSRLSPCSFMDLYLDRISSLSSVHISGSPWVSQKDSPNKLDVFLFRRKLLSASSRKLFKVFHYFPLVGGFFFGIGIGIGIDGPSPSYRK